MGAMFIHEGVQALESLVFRCPGEISPHIATVIQAGLQFIKYDPVSTHHPTSTPSHRRFIIELYC